jgi:hypothetical protein
MRGASPPQRTAGASRCTPRAPGAQTIDPGQLHCHQHGQPVSSAYHLRLPTPRRHATHTRPAHASHTRASHTRASHTHAHACASHTTPPCLPACSKKKARRAKGASCLLQGSRHTLRIGTSWGSAAPWRVWLHLGCFPRPSYLSPSNQVSTKFTLAVFPLCAFV